MSYVGICKGGPNDGQRMEYDDPDMPPGQFENHGGRYEHWIVGATGEGVWCWRRLTTNGYRQNVCPALVRRMNVGQPAGVTREARLTREPEQNAYTQRPR